MIECNGVQLYVNMNVLFVCEGVYVCVCEWMNEWMNEWMYLFVRVLS